MEAVERRTERSRTFLNDDGTFETEFYDIPVHFQPAQGRWQPIDNTLVAAADPAHAARNKANRFSALLPAALEATPLRVADGDRFVEFSLQGAKGGPTLRENTATYVEALPGTTVSYTVTNEGLKEELVLSGPQAASAYDFTVRLSPGLALQETVDGGIAVVDGEGGAWANLRPPFVHDASWPSSEAGFSTEAVSLKVHSTGAQAVVRLAVDPGWLSDPARVWPVTVDPTVNFIGGRHTYVSSSSPGSNYSSASERVVAGASSVRRILYKSDKDFNTFFAEPVDVLGAVVQLYATTDTTGQAVQPMAVHPLTADWASTEATWNSRRTGVGWASPGGDFAPDAVSVNPNVTGPVGVRNFDITSVVQDWANGTRPYHGVILKYQNEASGPALVFGPETSGGVPLPLYMVKWISVHGLRDPYRYETFSLGERRDAFVNVASGNLTIKERDLAVAGTGLDATVERFHVSRSPYRGSAGSRWRIWPQSAEGLSFSDVNEDVAWAGGPEEILRFRHKPDGSFASPHGYRGTMARNPDGSYTLSLHDSDTRHNFSASGYVSDIVDRNGNRMSFGYQPNSTGGSDLVSMTDTQGRVTTFERVGGTEVTKVIDPGGRAHSYGYTDANGNRLLTSYTDPAGKVTRYDYDSSRYLTKITDAMGNVTTFGYTRVASASGTSGFWDGSMQLTRLTRVTDVLAGTGPTWSFDYSTPWQTTVTDPRGNPTTYVFDRLGRVTTVTDAKGQPASATYSTNSFVASVTDQMSATSNMTYDARDNLTAATAPTGAKSQWAYDDTAHPYDPTATTSAQGNRMAYTYDSPGNLTSAQNGLAAQNQFRATHNPNGTVATSTDAMGNVTTYGYDPAGNLTSVNRPLGVGNRTLAYDGLSRLTSVTDAKNQRTTFTYDALDRLTKRTYADGTSITYTYDAGGALTRRDNSTDGATTFAYDALGRPTSKSINLATFTLGYDPAGNITAAGDFGGTVTYAYDSLNLLTSLSEPDGRITRFTNDAAGRRTSAAYPNGVTQTITYDASGRQTRITGKNAAGTVLTDFAYAYTNPTTGTDAGLRYRMTDPSGATNYTYDALDRLTGARSPAATYAYGYDGNSNRLSQTVGTTRTDYAYDAANRLTSAGPTTYSYDANGNLTGSSAGLALSYNAKDHTTRVQAPGFLAPSLDMAYEDADQTERAKAGGTNFESGFLGVAVINEALLFNTHQTRDNRGNLVAQRKDGGLYYLFDGLGSVVAITDGSGNVRNRYAYDPYGNPVTSGTSEQVGNPWGFAGGYRDTTGLTKFGARYYDPALGRWSQRDPVPSEPPYAYAADNPVNFVDPSGLSWVDKAGEVAGAIADGAGVVAGAAAVACAGGVGCPFAAAAGGVSFAAGAIETGIECRGGDECVDAGTGLAVNAAGFGAGKLGRRGAAALVENAGNAANFSN